MILRAPGLPPGRCGEPASLVDVTATILNLTHTPVPAHLDGVDLRTLTTTPPGRTLFVDTWRFDHHGKTYFDAVGAIEKDRKITYSLLDGDWGAYRLSGMDETFVQAPPDFKPLEERLTRALEETGLVVLNP